MIHAKPDDGTIWRVTENYEIGIVRYNTTWKAAGDLTQAAAGVLEPAAAIMALSGNAMTYVAFNKLFVINNFRL